MQIAFLSILSFFLALLSIFLSAQLYEHWHIHGYSYIANLFSGSLRTFFLDSYNPWYIHGYTHMINLFFFFFQICSSAFRNLSQFLSQSLPCLFPYFQFVQFIFLINLFCHILFSITIFLQLFINRCRALFFLANKIYFCRSKQQQKCFCHLTSLLENILKNNILFCA